MLTTDLRERLKSLHELTAQTPLFNPVFQLSLDVSRELESGKATLTDIAHVISGLECEAMQSRAHHLHDLIAPTAESENQTRLHQIVATSAHGATFELFAVKWAKPLLHIVFTGHPTFLLSPEQSNAIASAASKPEVTDDVCLEDAPRTPITLPLEHGQVIDALIQAAAARDKINTIILDIAATRWPNQWRTLQTVPYRLATWVGYDMDGRTDIGWATSICYRLQEKAVRLESYAARLTEIGGAPEIQALLENAARHSRAMEKLFATDLSDPAALSVAANKLTTPDAAKLLTLKPVIDALVTIAQSATAERANQLLTLANAMRADGLGLGGIHFRINAAQLHNAIRRRIDPDDTLDMASRAALIRLRALLSDVQPLRSNFAALAIENTTALRQFLAMAQIIHHIDADTPIRMLIAECEQPQSVLAALYFAKLFGIEDKVDVSPLFETESAMEHGGRFLEALLSEPIYQAYAKLRRRISIQTGFSDAGRFIGQIPAALAIERLQGRLAHIMAEHKLTSISALIFNTHGESMGRGAHPENMQERLRYPMSVWARQQFAKFNIPLELETSFQGGDGFLLYKTPELALATLTRITECEAQPLPENDDPFYSRTDISLDFYRGIRRVQRDHLASRTYARAITAFGLGFLNETGSRKSRRQSDLAADREMNLRQIRAIPHNAVLQQLGYPVNVLAGIGTAAAEDPETLVDLIEASPRAQSLFGMIRAANRLASIKSVAAYGELFNSAYWASRPYRGTEKHLENACLALAEHLTSDDRTGVFRRLASRLRVDGLKLHRLLAKLPRNNINPKREATRRSLGVLHALRLALMQHMFLRAVQIPAFSRSNDISRDDILEMIFTLRIEEAVTLLRRAFPVSSPSLNDFTVTEKSDYPDGETQAYAGIQSTYIDPIAKAHALSLRISIAIANHFGAHG
jgi:phosphoenolpyruvate carboxylase